MTNPVSMPDPPGETTDRCIIAFSEDGDEFEQPVGNRTLQFSVKKHRKQTWTRGNMIKEGQKQTRNQ